MEKQKLGVPGRTSIKNNSIGVRVFMGIGVWAIVMAIQGDTGTAFISTIESGNMDLYKYFTE